MLWSAWMDLNAIVLCDNEFYLLMLLGKTPWIPAAKRIWWIFGLKITEELLDWIGFVLRLILNWIFGVKMPFLSCRSVLFENLNRIFIFTKLPETTAFLPFRYLFSTAFLPLFYDTIFDPVCQLCVHHKWMLDKFTENYCIFTVWLLFCSTGPFEIFAMCFFSGPECILKCCSSSF
jgi:hypothetical protein